MPDRVQFTNWRNVYDNPWGYKVKPQESIDDSAVSMIWDCNTIDKNVSKTYTTYYGLTEFIENLTPPLELRVTPIKFVEQDVNSFQVTAHVNNISNVTASKVRLSIVVPDELKVLMNETLDLGNIKNTDDIRTVTWNIYIKNARDFDRTLSYNIVLEAENMENKSGYNHNDKYEPENDSINGSKNISKINKKLRDNDQFENDGKLYDENDEDWWYVDTEESERYLNVLLEKPDTKGYNLELYTFKNGVKKL